MIIFHEGLPGSGKSYEACVKHILPALIAGRDVLTNINGINHEKFSELSGVPIAICRQLIQVINHNDCDDEARRLELVKADFLTKTKKDSLVVIDEIQDLFPTERQKPHPEWSKYIASHRHEGLDIVLMGQDKRDVHPIWRRRIQRLLTFNKLTALGANNSYRWECWEATGGEKFSSVSSGIQKYDSKYFGLYSSHTAGTANKSVYTDDRANIFKNKNIRYAIIFLIIGGYFAINHAVTFFAADTQAPVVEPIQEKQPPKSQAKPIQSQARSSAAPEVEPPPLDIFDQEAKQGRLHLAVYMKSEEKEFARVEVRDSTNRVYSVYDMESLRGLGWTVSKESYGLRISKARVTHIARVLPVENLLGQVSQRRIETLGGSTSPSGASR